MDEKPFSNFGEAVQVLFYTMDQYEVCRKRMDALIKFDKERK